MEFKSQAYAINQFLQKTKALWDDEVLDSYPISLDKFPEAWVGALWNLPMTELHQFDSYQDVLALEGSALQVFIDEIRHLIKIDKAPISEAKDLEDWAFTDVKSKKKHEINRIAPLIKQYSIKKNISKVIDIGGGVGHLSRILSHYYSIPTVSIDRDQYFQERGKLRMEKYRKIKAAAELKFLNITFGDIADEKKLAREMDSNTFTIGLHTCGPLANNVINTSLKYKNLGLLSFGCCYHKLHPINDFSLSSYYKENFTLPLNLYSLTLASRAHCAISFEDFETKWRVKNYRQGLHLFLYHKLNIVDCFEVGEVHTREYWKPFEEYLKNKLDQLKINHTYTLSDFKIFFESEEIQLILKKMFLCNLIRWQIGRVLELYVLLDRAIYLEENNYEVQLEEYFVDTISPRNIGILAFRK